MTAPCFAVVRFLAFKLLRVCTSSSFQISHRVCIDIYRRPCVSDLGPGRPVLLGALFTPPRGHGYFPTDLGSRPLPDGRAQVTAVAR